MIYKIKIKQVLSILVLMIIILISLDSCSTHKSVRSEHTVHIDSKTYTKNHKLSKQQRMLIEEACSWSGTPYKYGGAEKGKGCDCSGLVLRVFLDVTDIKMPRNSASQAEFCKMVKAKKLQPCDLVFFATGKDSSKISHVGIMLDTANFIHASSSKGVIVTPLSSPWWNNRIIKFGRVPGL